MALINFKKEFAEKVVKWEKLQTIRKVRKNPIKVGDVLHFYTGLRTKQVQKLCVSKCTEIKKIVLKLGETYMGIPEEHYYIVNVWVDGKEIIGKSLEKFAEADGFGEGWQGVRAMAKFFIEHYGNEFEGVLIKWEV